MSIIDWIITMPYSVEYWIWYRYLYIYHYGLYYIQFRYIEYLSIKIRNESADYNYYNIDYSLTPLFIYPRFTPLYIASCI